MSVGTVHSKPSSEGNNVSSVNIKEFPNGMNALEKKMIEGSRYVRIRVAVRMVKNINR